MVNIVIEVSKYLLILLIAAYTYWNFSYFRFRDPWQQGRVCVRQNVAMFLLHFVAYAVLFLKSEDERVILFYLAQVVFLAVYLGLYKVFYPLRSRLLVNNMCMLLCIGFVILTRLDFDKAIRQFVIVAVSALITWIIPFILERVWQLANIPWVYGFAGLALLIVVWIIGNNSFGAQLSVNIAGIAFQPSEFVKILFVFFIASMLYKSTDLKQLAITSGVSAVFVLILVASNDLGGALLYFFTYLVMIYVATKKFYIFAGGLAFVGLGMYAGYHLFSHVKNRIVAWLDPLSVIDKAGYQVCQSLFAIGTGGLFGFGLGQGLPNKIPIVSKDFIIAAISEEMGGIFAVCLIMVCVSCFLMIFNLSMQMKDAFYKYVALGLGSVYALQVLLTVGGSTKFIPMTGVTLPLVSYGGSSLLSTMIIFGMIQGMYIMQAAPEKRRNIDDKRRKDHETKNRQKQTAKEPGAQGSQQRRRQPAAGGKNSTKTQK